MDEVVRATHVPSEAIAEAARLFGEPSTGAVVYSLDNIPQELQRDCVLALTDLVLLTGNLGKSGAGIYPMRPGANEQGAWDVGCVPNRLPGGRPRRDDAVRQSVEAAWQCVLPTDPGLGVAAALESARERRVKAMLIIGDSANFTNGRLGDALSALQGLDFLVVQDSFLSPTAQLADVVLPRVTFAEKDGTYTNLERRIQRLRPSVELKNSEARPESWLVCQLARRMNASGFDYNSPLEIMDEIARLSPIYAGVSYQRLGKEAVTVFRSGLESPKPTQLLYSGKEHRGVQWPCPSADAPSTPVLYLDGFPEGKANTLTPEFREPEPHLDPEFPAWLVPGRVLLQPDREVQIEEGKLNRVRREEWVQIHPTFADGLSIVEGDTVEVETPGGRIVGLARLDDSVPPGVVAVTALFGQLAMDLQTSEELDPMSKVPGLDILPARLSKVQMPAGV
jgi:predicted molibdopterin-dependent oxidoreductase YjgC